MRSYFGTWDAPITDDALRIIPPVGQLCIFCKEEITLDANGGIDFTGNVQHRECNLREVMGGIGHLVNHGKYCHGELGTDAGLTRRESSLLVWDLFVNKKLVTESDLEHLRLVREC